MKSIVLKNLSVDDLFSTVKIGVDEELYISSIDVDYIILSNNDGQEIKLFTDSEFIFNTKCAVNGIISCCGTLMLSIEDSFFIELSEVLSYLPPKNQVFKEEDMFEDEILRTDIRVKRWRDKVISRDKVCRCCGGDKHLDAHHIFSWKDYPNLRVDVDNGITLCRFCHHKYNSYYGHKGTGINLVNFLQRFGFR